MFSCFLKLHGLGTAFLSPVLAKYIMDLKYVIISYLFHFTYKYGYKDP